MAREQEGEGRVTDRVVMEIAGGVPPSTLLELQQPTPPEQIRWRAGAKRWGHECPPKPKRCEQQNDPSAHQQLAYVDARWVMERLDDVIGPANWSRKHLIGSDGRVACGIGILVEGVGWVEKWDGAGETDIEGQKGSFSDAFKRAAVSWGLARDLYSLDASKRQPSGATQRRQPQVAPTLAPVEEKPDEDWAVAAAQSVDNNEGGWDW